MDAEWLRALADDLKQVAEIIIAIGVIVIAVFQYLSKRAADKVAVTIAREIKVASAEREVVAAKVEETKAVLAEHNAIVDTNLQQIAIVAGNVNETTQSISAVADATHTLVNNKMAVELLAVKELSQWKADKEPTQANIDAADKAAKMYADHMAKQGRVDRGEKT